PEREVVSIYGDDFSTPTFRPPYFIEVYRCVKVEVGECRSSCKGYPVPKKTEEIQIVVPDIRNKDLDPSNKKKLYKYVVYNHTSCKCGHSNYGKTKLYKTITNNIVSEASFRASYSSNPVNLVRVCDVCKSPQRRYILTRGHAKVPPQSKYLAYQHCLPGCVA
ncbi:Hypothetical predicted protein, partial [Paramuricea clavata]